MLTKKQGLDQAKEKIRKALVNEYIKKHPGAREQDVVLACKDGELVFTEISSVLADSDLRKQSTQIFKQAASMFAELAIHQDERWKECVESVQHCMQMIDCLHSSLFGYYDDKERLEKEKSIKNQERLCARITVSLYEVTKEMKNAKMKLESDVRPKTRSLVIRYLNYVIDQLNVLHSVLNREVQLGDIFSEQTNQFIEIKLSSIKTTSAAFQIEDLSQIYKSLKGDKRASLDMAMDFNKNILLSTKKSLGQAVDNLRKDLSQRRKKIQEIWAAISNLQQTVEKLSDIQSLDNQGILSSPPEGGHDSPFSRMVRFLNRFTK